jgi:PPP family 3-phenylpropionic acid transporter
MAEPDRDVKSPGSRSPAGSVGTGLAPATRASIVYVAFFAAIGAGFPYLPVYFRWIGLDLAAIGLVTAVAAATQLVAAPAWGALNDRFPGARATILVAGLLAATAAVALSMVRGLAPIVLAVFALYAALAGIGPILDARTLDMLGPDRLRYGRVRAWGSVSFVVFTLIVGVMIDRLGPPGLFPVYVTALVVTGFLSLALAPRRPSRSVSMRSGVSALLRQRSMAVFLVGALLAWMALAAVNAFFSIYIVSLGGSDLTVGLAWAVGATVEVPLMWFFPALAGRFGADRLLIAGAVTFAVRGAAAAIIRDPAGLVAISVLEGFGYALFFTGGVTFVSRQAPPNLAATAQGVFSSVSGGLAVILGSLFGGLVAGAASIPGLFAIAATGSAMAAGVVWYAVRPGLAAMPAPEAAG